jgi:hypothetical protein
LASISWVQSAFEKQLFQIARKIVLAQYQFIVFNELLPEIIGTKRMKIDELQLLNGSQYLPASKYVSGQGKIFMEFSTAAGRQVYPIIDQEIPAIMKPCKKIKIHLNKNRFRKSHAGTISRYPCFVGMSDGSEESEASSNESSRQVWSLSPR